WPRPFGRVYWQARPVALSAPHIHGTHVPSGGAVHSIGTGLLQCNNDLRGPNQGEGQFLICGWCTKFYYERRNFSAMPSSVENTGSTAHPAMQARAAADTVADAIIPPSPTVSPAKAPRLMRTMCLIGAVVEKDVSRICSDVSRRTYVPAPMVPIRSGTSAT